MAVRSVEYNSWGKDVYKDLIVEIKESYLQSQRSHIKYSDIL